MLSDIYYEPKSINVNLIINVNPKKPPYSILALQKVWNDISIKLQSCVHSSVIGNVPEICICDINPPKPNVINLFLIWKEGKLYNNNVNK